jgi:hypothetical protein
MDPAAPLSTIAAVAVTITGFAGLLAAFRSSDGWQPVEMFAIRYLLLTSVSACLLALIPFPMTVGDYAHYWTACLWILATWLLLVVVWTMTETFRRKTPPRHPVRYIITQATGISLSAWAAVAALGASPTHQAAVYLWGLIWFVATSISQLQIQITHTLKPGARKIDQ